MIFLGSTKKAILRQFFEPEVFYRLRLTTQNLNKFSNLAEILGSTKSVVFVIIVFSYSQKIGSGH